MTEERTAPVGEDGDRDSAPDQEADTDNIHRPGVDYHPDTLAWALRYAQTGLAVFPLRPGSKAPYAGTNGHLDATTDPQALIDAWPSPDANVGIATGERSGIWVLDVDPRHGGDEALGELTTGNGHLPTTVFAQTQGGGRHIWFRWPKGLTIPCSAGKVGPGLDVKGEGGYIVAPPSRITDGGSYRFLHILRSPKGNRPVIAEAPSWLIAKAVERRHESRFAEPIVGTIGDGQRNVALTSLAGTMRDRGCEGDEIYALLTVANARRCDPPLAEREVRAIVASVMRYPPGRAWWAVGEAEDAAADEWLTAMQDEAARRWAGAR